ncbi:MAG: M56 family metallopeptidase [Acidobacteriaceae bacterium]
MEQILMEYIVNATWQIPLLAAAAWVFIRLGRFGPQTQHCIWLAVLGLAVGLPFLGVRADLPQAALASCTSCNVKPIGLARGESTAPVFVDRNSDTGASRWLEEFTELRRPTLRLSESATEWLAGLYLATFLFGLFRIVSAWYEARRLVNDSCATELQPRWKTMFEDSGRRLGAKLPQLRKSGEVHSPVVVGVLNPVLLLPENFDDHFENEIQAALYHELAHVRRHDYLGNMICRIAALPIVWHPVTYAVQQRIRRTREMVCDQLAAREMQSRIGYAKCLLTMAQRTLGQRDLANSAQAMGLFGDNMLEERIMRLMKGKGTMTVRMKLARVASGATAMILATAMAASFHVTPTLAQTTGKAVTVPASPTPPAPPAPDTSVAPAAPVVPVTPAAPDEALVPVAPMAPVPAEAKPSRKNKKVVQPHPKKVKDESVIDVDEAHVLTAAQQARLREEMDAMNAQIAAATKHLDSPEFQRQMADLAKQQTELKNLDLAKIQREIDNETVKLNSPEFQRQMENFQKQLASDDIQRRMAEASTKLKAAEAQAQQQVNLKALDMSKIQQQIDAATAKINSREFQRQMENLQKQLAGGELQRRMEQAAKAMKDAESQMGQVQTK